MKHSMVVAIFIFSIISLTGCAQSMNSTTTPSLSQSSRPTSRMPSPSNYRQSTLMQSSTMMAPQ